MLFVDGRVRDVDITYYDPTNLISEWSSVPGLKKQKKSQK